MIILEANDEMETCNEGMKSVGRSRGILSVTRGFIGFVWNGVQGLHETRLPGTKAMSVTPHNWVTVDHSQVMAEMEHWRSQAYANNSRYQIR